MCVALVKGTTASVVVPGSGTAYFYSSAGGSPAPCYSNGATDGSTRVQVVVSRPAAIEAVAFKFTVVLGANANARFEF